MRDRDLFLPSLFVAAAIVLGGWFIGNGFVKSRTADRFVTVKGLAERDVRADVALWPISFVATDDDLGLARQRIVRNKQAIITFLARNGIDSTRVEVQGLEVTDVLANAYRSGPTTSRFIINQTLMVRSEDPEAIRAASQRVGDLVDAGVVLSASGGPGYGPTFLFTELNDLKPEMIAEATANARRAAEQFAADSGSGLGAIRRANQGVFVIRSRDRAPGISEGSQMHKTVRVVATVDYFLQD